MTATIIQFPRNDNDKLEFIREQLPDAHPDTYRKIKECLRLLREESRTPPSAIIEWPHGLASKPTFYIVGQTEVEEAEIRKALGKVFNVEE